MANLIVVSYDIPDDRRRLRLAHALKDFGARVQYSAFECHLEPDGLETLRKRLAKLVRPGGRQCPALPLLPGLWNQAGDLRHWNADRGTGTEAQSKWHVRQKACQAQSAILTGRS